MRVRIPHTKYLRKYLGVPLTHQRKRKATFLELIDRFNKRLVDLEASCLSLVGGITLTKTMLVITSIRCKPLISDCYSGARQVPQMFCLGRECGMTKDVATQ